MQKVLNVGATKFGPFSVVPDPGHREPASVGFRCRAPPKVNILEPENKVGRMWQKRYKYDNIYRGNQNKRLLSMEKLCTSIAFHKPLGMFATETFLHYWSLSVSLQCSGTQEDWSADVDLTYSWQPNAQRVNKEVDLQTLCLWIQNDPFLVAKWSFWCSSSLLCWFFSLSKHCFMLNLGRPQQQFFRSACSSILAPVHGSQPSHKRILMNFCMLDNVSAKFLVDPIESTNTPPGPRLQLWLLVSPPWVVDSPLGSPGESMDSTRSLLPNNSNPTRNVEKPMEHILKIYKKRVILSPNCSWITNHSHGLKNMDEKAMKPWPNPPWS